MKNQTSETIRPKLLPKVGWSLIVFIVIITLISAFLLLKSHDGVTFYSSDRLALIGLGICLCILPWFLTRPYAKLTDQKLILQNFVFKKIINWEDITECSFETWFASITLINGDIVMISSIFLSDGHLAVENLKKLKGYIQYRED